MEHLGGSLARLRVAGGRDCIEPCEVLPRKPTYCFCAAFLNTQGVRRLLFPQLARLQTTLLPGQAHISQMRTLSSREEKVTELSQSDISFLTLFSPGSRYQAPH